MKAKILITNFFCGSLQIGLMLLVTALAAVQSPAEPAARKLDVRFTGIFDGRALFQVQGTSIPGGAPAAPVYCTLSEGQKEGEIEVLSLDVKAEVVKIRVADEVRTLSLNHDGIAPHGSQVATPSSSATGTIGTALQVQAGSSEPSLDISRGVQVVVIGPREKSQSRTPRDSASSLAGSAIPSGVPPVLAGNPAFLAPPPKADVAPTPVLAPALVPLVTTPPATTSALAMKAAEMRSFSTAAKLISPPKLVVQQVAAIRSVSTPAPPPPNTLSMITPPRVQVNPAEINPPTAAIQPSPVPPLPPIWSDGPGPLNLQQPPPVIYNPNLQSFLAITTPGNPSVQGTSISGAVLGHMTGLPVMPPLPGRPQLPPLPGTR